jgi:hypothetical protein
MTALAGVLLLLAAERTVTALAGCSPGEASRVPFGTLSVNPEDPEEILAGSETVYGSTRAGDCLARSNTGLVTPFPIFPRPVTPLALAIDPGDSAHVLLGSTQGLWTSHDGGASWSVLLVPEYILQEAHINAVAFDPRQTEIVYAVGDDVIYKSVDGGSSWAPKTSGFPTPPGSLQGASQFAFDPLDSETVYLAGAGVYRTTDGGGLWMRETEGLPPPGFVSAILADRDGGRLLAGTAEGLFASDDDGESWLPAGLSGRAVYALVQDPLDPNRFFAGTDVGAYRSPDRGAHWLAVPAPFAEAWVSQLTVAPSEPSTLYAATEIGVYRSRDGGADWDLLAIDRRAPRVMAAR